MYTKVERSIYQNGESDGYCVRFCFKDRNNTRHFATLEQAREYRDEIEKEKLRLNLLEDKRFILEAIQREMEIAKPWPYNLFEAMNLDVSIVPTSLCITSEDPQELSEIDWLIYGVCTEREADMINQCYFQEETLQNIGEIWHVSKQRVGQIITSGLKKVRHAILRYEADKEFEARMDMRRDLINALKENGVLTEDMQYEFGPLRMWRNEAVEGGGQVISIEDLDLSIRSWNCLRRAGIMTINQLVELDQYDLMKVKNLGKKSYREIMNKLHDYGYCLKDEVAAE